MDYRVVSIVRDHARARGGSPAITGDGRTLTYSDLDDRSSRIAQALLATGLGRGSRVGYLGKNAPEFFELMFGAAKIGAVVTPVNWRLTSAEIGGVVGDAQAAITVVDTEFAEIAAELPGRVILTGPDYEKWVAAWPADDPGFSGEPDDVVVQLYTSGTTGLPKGVQLTNVNFAVGERMAARWRLDESSVTAVPMPLFHIGGSGWALAGLYAGCHIVLIRDIDPAALVDTFERERITNAFIVPAVLQFMCQVPGAADRDYSALRAITYGASPITSEVLRRSLDTFRAPLFQLYGMTETTGAIVQLEPEDHDPEGPRAHLMRSAGRPYDWVEIKAVDPATGEERAPGEVGEILIRSSQNTPGYWNRPADTEKLQAGDGWLRTGDAGYVDAEGYLFLTDRIKDMIVTGAENVYPIEVEEVLASHPGIADVAVIGVPDERWGETVKAVVVRRPGTEPTEEDILEFAKGRLAGFKRPRSVDFVDALPRNPSGKILKKDLRAPYWDGLDRSIA
ncbi:long-chain-fatty-acid--CoA ligase [Actinomadura barringtoniae]|uniref:Long-chain-fatty-acid--CoA ligase n=1 Tax=Actinomadura barringtoniae TaxID=1427535 RepID=A0A939PRN4_9ACTN|nr:long-chain-fatty-acid--CoA ligase [Actinomadura barringtoniae]MBO2454998.1 long-chain-fatty-acid--CoA ligase [Actinomadura barringtoniae]